MKLSLDGYITAYHDWYSDTVTFGWLAFDPAKSKVDLITVCPYTITIDVPDDFNLTNARLENLALTRAETITSAASRLVDLDRKIETICTSSQDAGVQ